MTAGVCACMFSNKVTGGGRQDGGTDGLTLDWLQGGGLGFPPPPPVSPGKFMHFSWHEKDMKTVSWRML